MQVSGLRGSLSGGLLLRRRELVIHPDECIDCGVCEPECPAEAILPDTEPDVERWVEVNRTYAEQWPNINRKGETPGDADDWKDVANKFEDHFSDQPAAQ